MRYTFAASFGTLSMDQEAWPNIRWQLRLDDQLLPCSALTAEELAVLAWTGHDLPGHLRWERYIGELPNNLSGWDRSC